MDYRSLASQIAQQQGVPVDLFLRLVNQESGFRPDVTSPAGAHGLAQLMPGTASDLGVDINDPVQNLTGGAMYLRRQLDQFGDPALALAAYNAGPGNVQKYGGVPPFEETQNYVRSILGGAPVQVSTSGGPSMPMQEQPRGLFGFLGGEQTPDARTADQRKADLFNTLALGFNEMRLRPSQSLATGIQNRMASDRQGRQQQAIANRTAEWLSQQPNSAAYVEMLAAGANPAQVLQAYQAARSGGDIPSAFAALDRQARAAGLEPGTPQYQEFMLYGGASREDTPAAFRALDEQAKAAGLEPGTPEYQEFMLTRGAGAAAQSRAQGTAQGEAAAQVAGAEVAMNRTLGLIDLVRNDPALSSMVGPIQGRLPNISADAQRFQSRLDQLQGTAFLEAYNMLRGGGQITEVEGQKAEAAMARLKTAQSEEDFLQALTEFEDAVRTGYAKLQAGAGAAPQAAPTQPAPQTSSDDPLGLRR